MPKNIQWANIFFSRQNNLLTSHIFFLFLYTSIHQYLMNSSSKNEVKFKILLSGIHFSLCLFLIRNLSAIQDREICCYSISCKEKDNIGTTQTHTHAHKLKKMYVLCALALKLCSEQFCYFVETTNTSLHFHVKLKFLANKLKPA